MKSPRRLSLASPPLALQIMGLLVGGLLVAQLVTLILTLVLPPEPTPQFQLDDIASTLAGASGDGKSKGLQRKLQAGPPDVNGPGWLVSERSRHELAELMGVEDSRVSLAFFTPLPFAGAAAPRALAMANDGYSAPLHDGNAGQKLHVQFVPNRDAMPSGTATMPPQGFTPGAGFTPNGQMPPFAFHGRGPNGRPGEAMRDGQPPPPVPRGFGRIDRGRPLVSIDSPTGAAVRLPDYGTTVTPADARTMMQQQRMLVGPALTGPRAGAVRTEQMVAGGAMPPLLIHPGERPNALPGFGNGALPTTRMPMVPVPQATPLVQSASRAVDTAPIIVQSAPATAPVVRAPVTSAPVVTVPAPIQIPTEKILPNVTPPQAAAPKPAEETRPAGPPIRVEGSHRTLFGIAPAPFVQGDFVAALKVGDGRWAIVQPAPEPFPNAWQRRVLLWFVIALALVAPVGWLFARRLVKPIDRFAGAAEQLGRDPAAEIGKLDGPAEIGRAAHAFNLMQNRLRAFVDDRTAMVGAISHDLRTPLTRMRFRIEDVAEDDVRDGLLEEVDEMEAMIAQVIDFLRDASAPSRRERLDLNTIVEDVVEDVRMIGGDVVIEQALPARVEVDVLGMKRLFDNLLENAVKYGVRARIRLRTDGEDAVAEIIDDGPGLPEEEMEHVFEPFYRSEAARNSDKAGSGLGLAVCRSIARAHGGDIRLHRGPEGFTAELRVPLVYGSEKPILA